MAESTGDIVVTAQRREQRLQDVPISVQVTSGDSIRKAAITDLLTFSQRVPGLKLGLDTQSNHIVIRGVGSGVNAGFEQSVGTFIDGVYRARSRTVQASLFDIDRVEVLNGPQSTFFGNNTVAGAINITSRKPSETFGVNATALYSPSDGQYIAEIGVTSPVTKTLSVRGAIQLSGMDGYSHNTFLNRDEPRLRDIVGRAAIRWKPSPGFESNLRFDIGHNRDIGTFNAEIEGCPPPPGYPAVRGPCAAYIAQTGGQVDNRLDFHEVAGPSEFRLDMKELAWTNRLDLGAVSLNSITSYSEQQSFTALNASPLPVTGVAGYLYQPFSQGEHYHDFAQELRLESQSTGWLRYTLGAYYSRQELSSASYSSLYNNPAAGSAGAPVTGPTTPVETNRNLFQTSQTRSAFGQLTASLAQQLKLSAGLRYTSVQKDARRLQRAGIGGPTASPSDFVEPDPATEAKLLVFAGASNTPFAQPSKTFDKLLPSASFQYSPLPSLTGYFSYTKGFKAGGFADANNPAQFDSENVDAYEVGIKGSLLRRRLFFTLDGFDLQYAGLQQSINFIGPTGVSISSVGNAANSSSKGIEFTSTYRAADFLALNAAASYVYSNFTNYSGGPCTALQIATVGASCVQNLSGRPTPYAPRISGTLSATLTMPVASYEIRLDPSLYFSSSYYLTPSDDALIRQGSYQLADMRIGFGPSSREWEIAVIGKNLNNARVTSSASVIGTSPGLAYHVLDRARSVAFTGSVKF